ncbi:MAG TPA: Trk system potassium transporter TrkA [bacterium]|nr:Trk system potassium transporter TrkA [bacterium]
MKKIVIVGAGEIGTFLADRLSAEQIEVTVIDRNPDVLAKLHNMMDVAGVLGNATSVRDLLDAGVQDADLFIATTRQDETNLIACLLARELKVPHTIAVTRYLGLRGQAQQLDPTALNIDLLVNSSEAVKNEVMDILETTGASEVARFAEGRIILIGFQVPDGPGVATRTVGEVCAADEVPRFSIAGIVRANELLEHGPDFLLQPGDYLYIITTSEHLPALNSVLGVETVKTRNAVIFGDNFLSQILATALLSRHFHVTMLAATEDKARFLRNHFQGQRHFQVETGSGTEVRLLRRVKVPSTSVFIASNTDDAANLTACMCAKALGAGKTIATIRRTDILPLCRKAGVDVNVAPRLATAKVIQRVVHENRVVDYRAVSQTNLEVIEVVAKAGSKAVKSSIKSLKLPKGAIIGAIASASGASLPTPEVRIQPDDKVIVLTLPEHLLEVEEFFGG